VGRGLASTDRGSVSSRGAGWGSGRGSGAFLSDMGFTRSALSEGVVEDGGGGVGGDVGGMLSVLSSTGERVNVLGVWGRAVGTTVGPGAGDGGETGGGTGVGLNTGAGWVEPFDGPGGRLSCSSGRSARAGGGAGESAAGRGGRRCGVGSATVSPLVMAAGGSVGFTPLTRSGADSARGAIDVTKNARVADGAERSSSDSNTSARGRRGSDMSDSSGWRVGGALIQRYSRTVRRVNRPAFISCATTLSLRYPCKSAQLRARSAREILFFFSPTPFRCSPAETTRAGGVEFR
jgi:hypothetical protein